MFELFEKEISEIIYKDPYKYCIMGIHYTPDKNNIYTIFVRGDIINKDDSMKKESEIDGCRISLLSANYIDLGDNIILTDDEKKLFNKIMHDNWKTLDLIKTDDITLNECPNYLEL